MCWLCWQLLRQNGRLLLRLDELELRLNQIEFGEDDRPSRLPVGSEAPDFDLPDLKGKQHTLSQHRGEPVLLIFFNPACGFCRQLLPKLANVAAGFQPAVEGGILPPGDLTPAPAARPNWEDGLSSDASSAGLEAQPNGSHGSPPLQVLILSTGGAEVNRTLFSEHNLSWRLLLQKETEIAAAYQASGTPSGYLISPEGKIASDLAVGGEALLQLTASKSEILNPESEIEHDREARFHGRSLARSKIKRNGLKAGTVAPDFKLPRLDGNGDLSLSDFRGRQVLLVFSSPTCGPCLILAPQLEKFHRGHPKLEILMVSKGEPKENRAKVKEHGLTFPIVLQQQWEISRRYAMFATPIAYLIDDAGVIANEVAVGMEPILALLTAASRQASRMQESLKNVSEQGRGRLAAGNDRQVTERGDEAVPAPLLGATSPEPIARFQSSTRTPESA